eukprot:TRINITY_DN3406_c0_g1_i1.p1 TRINITY_DN3406_c0_g1~~TRINITY_DN3406_c0_g1_i1.p1  ORF type:complete len:515 (+),score=143.30 TRINITY_DN3406_c0_g1_i1:51-1547(+)
MSISPSLRQSTIESFARTKNSEIVQSTVDTEAEIKAQLQSNDRLIYETLESIGLDNNGFNNNVNKTPLFSSQINNNINSTLRKSPMMNQTATNSSHTPLDSIKFTPNRIIPNLNQTNPSEQSQQTSYTAEPFYPTQRNLNVSEAVHLETSFLDRLQDQHKSRLIEAIQSYTQIIEEKDKEIEKLSELLNENTTTSTSRESEIKEELHNLRVLQAKQLQDQSESFEEERLQHKELIRSLEDRYEREKQVIAENYARELEDLRLEMQATIQNMENTKIYALEQQARKLLDADQKWQDTVHDLRENHKLEINRLRDVIKNESDKLQDSRNEVCNITLEKGNELISYKSKVGDLQRQLDFNNREHLEKLKELSKMIQEKENEWRLASSKIINQLEHERNTNNTTIKSLTNRIKSLEMALKTKSEEYKRKQREDNMKLNQYSQKIIETEQLNNHLNKLLSENGIAKEEISFLEQERFRLTRELNSLRATVSHNDAFIYGTKNI